MGNKSAKSAKPTYLPSTSHTAPPPRDQLENQPPIGHNHAAAPSKRDALTQYRESTDAKRARLDTYDSRNGHDTRAEPIDIDVLSPIVGHGVRRKGRAPSNAEGWMEHFVNDATSHANEGTVDARAKALVRAAAELSSTPKMAPVVIDLADDDAPTTSSPSPMETEEASANVEGQPRHVSPPMGATAEGAFDRYRALLHSTQARAIDEQQGESEIDNLIAMLRCSATGDRPVEPRRASPAPSSQPRPPRPTRPSSVRSSVDRTGQLLDRSMATRVPSFDFTRLLSDVPSVEERSATEWERVANEQRERRLDDQRKYNLARDRVPVDGVLVRPRALVDTDFKPLLEVHVDSLAHAWNTSLSPSDVLAKAFNVPIARKDLLSLRPGKWLNDEVINFYMELIVDRAKSSATHDRPLPTVYTYNTFMYTTLLSAGYKKIARWTRKVDIFSFDVLLVPVHLGMHWCLAVIDTRQRLIRYFDSMLGDNTQGMMALRDYLADEHMDKKKTALNVETWEVVHEDIPQQYNGYDCGMFACKFADFVSRARPITFTQKNMDYFRKRAVVEIMQKKLMA